MSSTIQLKTGTGSAVPSSLTQGEVAINVDNGLFYYGSGSTNTPKQLESFTHITASGDISASGTIVGSNLSGTNTGDQDLSSYSTIVQLNASSSALQTNIDAKASITQLNASSSALQTNIDAKVSNSSTASFAITGSNVTFANITSSGGIRTDKLILTSNGSVSDMAIHYSTDSNTGIYFPAPDNISLQAGGGNVELNLNSNGINSTGRFNLTGAITASGNISSSGDVITNNITASNLDISGDVDIDGTLEADAITVNGTALSTVIAATTVANAVNSTNTTNVNVLATTDNADFFVTMVDGASSDQRVESSTKLKFNPSNGNFFIEGNITASGAISASGEIETNTVSTVTTVIGSDAATNVDTFATSTYNGAIYDYILKDSTVGARAGQFMVAHDDGDVTFTDVSTKHLSDSTIPEITADISGADVRVRVTNGNGYTFKSFVKKL